MKSLSFSPIGYFRRKSSDVNSYVNSDLSSDVDSELITCQTQDFTYDLPRQPTATIDAVKHSSYIELLPRYEFEKALQNLDGFSKIWVIFHFHLHTHWNPKVLPPRGSRQKLGVFSTRSPYRPNPIGMSCVDLILIKDLEIHIGANDLMDSTPILDIKPYLPYCDSFPNAKTGWLENIEHTRWSVEFSKRTLAQLSFLENHQVINLRPFIIKYLEYDPFYKKTKRLLIDSQGYVLCYRTWRASFTADMNEKKILVLEIFSSYPEEDLNSADDPYGDKVTHRRFAFQNFPN